MLVAAFISAKRNAAAARGASSRPRSSMYSPSTHGAAARPLGRGGPPPPSAFLSPPPLAGFSSPPHVPQPPQRVVVPARAEHGLSG